jgi:hypothetical protein
MPIATANIDGEKFELKSLPGAWVMLRRLTYGQKIERQQSSSKLLLNMEKGQKSMKGEMAMLQMASTLYDFRNCVVDHNLEKAAGGSTVKLDLSNQADVSILDPRVGEEIAVLLDKLNNFEEEATEMGN